ncbi:MAG: hypothetical protein J6R82_04495 [Clostridia bacterium]|nr:hypothetical protein [Clostridia bacterium]
MIAKVKTNGLTVYDSVIFAYTEAGFQSQIVVWNSLSTTLKVIPLFDGEASYVMGEQNYLILDAAIDGFIQRGNTVGYPWLLEDEALLKKIRAGEALPEEILARCNALQDAISLPQWFEVTDEASAANLLWAGSNFHDSSICAIEQEDGFATITLSTWAGDILVRVKDPVLSPQLEACNGAVSSFGQIWRAHICFWGDRIYFVDAMGDVTLDDLSDDWLYFSGTRMFWKIELE